MIRDNELETGIALAARAITTFVVLERFVVRCHVDSTTFPLGLLPALVGLSVKAAA